MQIVEVLSDIGDAYKAGQIVEMKDEAARFLTAVGQVKESDAGSLLRQSNKADMDKFKAELLGEIRTALKPSGNTNSRTPAPPGRPGAAEFGDRIEGDNAIDPAKLKPMERNFHAGRMVRALLCAQSSDAPAEEREWGNNLLRNLYCHKDRVDYRVGDEGEARGASQFDPNTSVARTGTESVSGGPTYGFLVRPEWSDTLFRLPIEESVIEPYAFQIPVGQALEFKMPALDQYGTPTAGQSSAYAGFQVSRKGEITQRQYSDGKVNEIDYKVTDLTAFTTYSRDLDADAFIRIGSMIQQVLGQAFVWKKDYEFIQGNGVGMPLGILNGGAAYTSLPPSVLYQTRHASNTITYEDIVGMMQQIHPAYWREMYFITNAAQTLVQLMSIKNNAGNYVYQPNSLVGQWQTPTITGEGSPYNNLTWRAEGKLEGKPVLFSEKLPQLGTTGDLILVNPRYAYGVATRMGLEMLMSEHFLFDTDRIAVKWKLRNDAKPLLRGPYVQSDGGITSGNSKVSWCCVLH